MFNYLFVTYLLLAVTAVGRLILPRDRALFLDLANEAGLAVPFAVGVAYVLAGAFARPMAVLNDGALGPGPRTRPRPPAGSARPPSAA